MDAALAVALQNDAAVEHVTELLAVVRLDLKRFAARGKLDQDWLHLVLLRVGNDPVDGAAFALVDKKVLRVEDELVVFILLKEFREVGAEGLEDVAERIDRGGGEVAL